MPSFFRLQHSSLEQSAIQACWNHSIGHPHKFGILIVRTCYTKKVKITRPRPYSPLRKTTLERV